MLEITDLPPQIVAAVNAFAKRLSDHIRRHRDASLDVHEQGVLDAWRAEAASVLAGVVTVARKPSIKARERFVRKVKAWVRVHRHDPVRSQQKDLARKLNGHYQYYGLHHCTRALSSVRYRIQKLWLWALQHRSQKAKRQCDWSTLHAKPWFRLPSPRVTQPWV